MGLGVGEGKIMNFFKHGRVVYQRVCLEGKNNMQLKILFLKVIERSIWGHKGQIHYIFICSHAEYPIVSFMANISIFLVRIVIFRVKVDIFHLKIFLLQLKSVIF